MRRFFIQLSTVISCAILSGCGNIGDDNDTPVYGKQSGLPVNCRAYVQVSIDDYRAGKFSADDLVAGLERNCGVNGQIWKNRR